MFLRKFFWIFLILAFPYGVFANLSSFDESHLSLEKYQLAANIPVDSKGQILILNKAAEPETRFMSFGEMMQNLIWGGSPQEVSLMEQNMNSDDTRLNRWIFSVLPALLYNDSQSSYSYRRYSTFNQGIEVGILHWFNPFLGLSINELMSENASLSSQVQGVNFPITYRFYDFSLHWRRFLDTSELEFLITFIDQYMKTPADNNERARLTTRGWLMQVMGKRPIDTKAWWIMGFSYSPRLEHNEWETGIHLQSAVNVNTSQIGFVFGTERASSRSFQWQWRLEYIIQNHLFEGYSNYPDASTGALGQNVSVRNQFLNFKLGFSWGS